MSDRILVVDDEPQVRNLLSRILGRHGYSCALAGDAGEAHARLREEDFALVLSDLNMPGESGLGVLESVRAEWPDTATVMISGQDDPGVANAAFEAGAYGYILKPFRQSEVVITIASALRRRALEAENRGYRRRLEDTVRRRTADLQATLVNLERTADELRSSREETIRRLARAVETRDGDTGCHIERMSRVCGLVAERIGLDPEPIVLASPLHDAGKIAIRDSVLLKPGPLTEDERREMQAHCEIGHRLLAGSGSALLELAATIALTHHERWDGRGYPRGLAGEAIPVEGRIAAVADVFDALTTARVYRPALSVDEAVETMLAERGAHFEPRLVDALLDSLDDVIAIRERFDAAGALPAPLGPRLAPA